MSSDPQRKERLLNGYDRMMERVKAVFDRDAEHGIVPTVAHAIDVAKEKAVELQELSREEAERIGRYLRRDMEDAGKYMATSQGDLGDWLQFDLELIEERLADALLGVADRTKVELAMLEEQARHADEYLADDVTGPGTLRCAACGEVLTFRETSHIPPCPACGATLFQRQTPEPEPELGDEDVLDPDRAGD